MKTKYKHIHFMQIGATDSWACVNNQKKEPMGLVNYYPQWKRYVMDFREGCVFDTSCLADIIDFINQLKDE